MTHNRLIDPIHFFNERGEAIVNTEHLRFENKRLEAENEDLRRRLRAMVIRFQALGEPITEENAESGE